MHPKASPFTQEGPRGRAVLMLCHVVGMIDLVALPVWVGVLVQHYGFDLEHAGITVTAFLVGAVLASLAVAPRFHRLPPRAWVAGAYAIACAGFLAAANARSFHLLALVHLFAGLAVGTALSITHGTIGRSASPHRLFAMAGAALGVGAVVFYAAVPPAVAVHGGSLLFQVISALMALAALASLGFPQAGGAGGTDVSSIGAGAAPLSRAAWCAIFGIGCMALNQALTYSMLDRIGIMRGFGQERVNTVLLICGIVNLAPAVLAAALEKRLGAVKVALVAAPIQTLLALVVTLSADFVPYALAASVYPAVLIFTHTFVFGLIARLDPSGRALASTPAMMMTGAAIGPALAGSVAMRAGPAGQAMLAAAVGLTALTMFAMVASAVRAAKPTGSTQAPPRSSVAPLGRRRS